MTVTDFFRVTFYCFCAACMQCPVCFTNSLTGNTFIYNDRCEYLDRLRRIQEDCKVTKSKINILENSVSEHNSCIQRKPNENSK